MKTIYNKNYVTYYKDNSAALFIYKSSRKNAKCELINISHLISKTPDKMVKDQNILYQFISVVDKIINQSLQYNKHIELTYYATIYKQSEYINANNDLYRYPESTQYSIQREKFYSVEQCINRVYDLFSLLYPYNKLNREEVFKNSSIKYFINLYYHGRA